MTEQTFIDLNFERNDVSVEESGHENDFHYYTLDIGDICLITNASDEAEKDGWWCSVFDSETLKIRGGGDLEDLVKILRLNSN
jgi:hypothetical protein